MKRQGRRGVYGRNNRKDKGQRRHRWNEDKNKGRNVKGAESEENNVAEANVQGEGSQAKRERKVKEMYERD